MVSSSLQQPLSEDSAAPRAKPRCARAVPRFGKPDRVVIVCDDSTETGGAAIITLLSARLLRERGIPVTLLVGDAGHNPELTALGVDIVPIGGRHILEGNRASAALRGLYSHQTYRVIKDWISANDTPATVYHLHNWHKVLSASAFAALTNVDSRLVISTHDYFLVCPNGGFSHFPKNEACSLVPMSAACLCTACDKRNYSHKLWRVARHAIRQSLFRTVQTRATILAVHEGMLGYLKLGGIPDRVIQVLRNPVVPWCSERVPAERNRHIFFVGRIEPDKGVDVLARAARAAGAPLKIIGEGSLRNKLESEHPEVEFLGYLANTEIGRAVMTARLVIVPSRTRETFGLTAVEALASGIPVITSKLVPIAEELVAADVALAYESNDESQLVAQIGRLMHDDTKIAAMSRTALSIAPSLAPSSEYWCNALIRLYVGKIDEAARGSGLSLPVGLPDAATAP